MTKDDLIKQVADVIYSQTDDKPYTWCSMTARKVINLLEKEGQILKPDNSCSGCEPLSSIGWLGRD